MSYRRWFHSTVVGTIGIMLLLAGALWIVDPIELWEAPVIYGFNHIKPKQASFLHVFKPFQVQRHKPDVVYIGTSRVYVGFKPEEDAYNMGGSSLPLPDVRSYLRFVYSQHVPKKVFVGLDLFQFSHAYMKGGAADERMAVLTGGNIASFCEAWKTSFGMMGYMKETIKNSMASKKRSKLWERGYDVTRGERADIEVSAYYSYLHSFYQTYTNFTYDSEAITCLMDILEDAKAHGVEIVLFFNPVSVDLLALQQIYGKVEIFQEIKKKVAKLHTVHDFAWASSLALDRKGVWLDGSHYHRPVGDRMKESMTENVDSEICRVLTAETVEAHLREEAAIYERWAGEHSDYIQALAVAAPEKIPVGTLAQYLGF